MPGSIAVVVASMPNLVHHYLQRIRTSSWRELKPLLKPPMSQAADAFYICMILPWLSKSFRKQCFKYKSGKGDKSSSEILPLRKTSEHISLLLKQPQPLLLMSCKISSTCPPSLVPPMFISLAVIWGKKPASAERKRLTSCCRQRRKRNQLCPSPPWPAPGPSSLCTIMTFTTVGQTMWQTCWWRKTVKGRVSIKQAARKVDVGFFLYFIWKMMQSQSFPSPLSVLVLTCCNVSC